MQTIQQFIEVFEETFTRVIEAHIERSISFGSTTRVRNQLVHIKQVAGSGKRFRPYILNQSYRIYGGTEPIDEILVAIELLHVFALIHDDIMDRAHTRHNVATSHVFGTQLYQEVQDADSDHRGSSQGILIGDLVFSWSVELFFEGIKKYPLEKRARLQSMYFTLINEVIVGQMIDVDISAQKEVTHDMVITKNTLKTGNYSFVRPLVLGALLADASQEQIDFVTSIGGFLGTAFQAQDDLLDMYGVDTGKDLCTDITQCQQTLISAYMYEKGGAHLESFIAKQGKVLTSQDIEELKDLVKDSGVYDSIQDLIKESFDSIRSRIENIKPEEKEVWENIVTLVEKRKK